MGRSAPAPLLLLAFLLWRCLAAKAGCEKGTYRDAQRQTCSPCTPCQGKYEYARRCSEDSNAVCKCALEYECGNLECGSCICGIGEEWNGEGCQVCPEGKFKSWISGKCQNWTQCPGNQISIPGTAKTDVVCNTTTEGPTQPPTWLVITKKTEQDSHLVPISIALVVVLLLCMLFLVLFCIFFRSWAREKFPAVILKGRTIPYKNIPEYTSIPEGASPPPSFCPDTEIQCPRAFWQFPHCEKPSCREPGRGPSR